MDILFLNNPGSHYLKIFFQHTNILSIIRKVAQPDICIKYSPLWRLVGNGKVSSIEARQNEVRLVDIAIKVAQEKSC